MNKISIESMLESRTLISFAHTHTIKTVKNMNKISIESMLESRTLISFAHTHLMHHDNLFVKAVVLDSSVRQYASIFC